MGKGMGFLQQSAEGMMILLVSTGYGVYIGLGLLSCLVALATWVSKTIYAPAMPTVVTEQLITAIAYSRKPGLVTCLL
jgi:hypothetical protein